MTIRVARKQATVRKLLWLLIPAAALLAGCYSIENSYVVNEDGSGSQTVRFSIPMELFASLGNEAPALSEIESDSDIQAMRAALGENGSLSFFSSEEEGFGLELVINVPASDDFGQALTDLAPALPQDSGFSLGEVQGALPAIRREGDTWSFQLESAAITGEDIAALTGDPDTAGMASLFLDQITMTTRVRLPGDVTEHNADDVLEDGTLVWNQTGADEARLLTATSEIRGGSNQRLILIVAGVLVAAAVLAAAAYFATRGLSADDESDNAGAETPPTEPTV